MKKFHVAGFASCGAYQAAKSAVHGLSIIFPSFFGLEVHENATRDEYMEWLASFRDSVGASTHKTSPLVWFEGNVLVGGRDDTLAWIRNYLKATNHDVKSVVVNDSVDNKNHGFEYDLIVIGGGSGGLACSKEAQKLGAKVAVLDYVKPSPIGSKWGLGGTCVNVGCIPKKLMHNAALLGELSKDAVGYGWEGGNNATHNWATLRENVQNHIKGLNFGYRVQLREAGITYLNKLGKLTSPNTVECTDAKGNVQTISAARVVVAVGGRPTPLECPGAEYAITSDDLFMKETPPGKTCVVGAGYVALECAGFINGMNQGEVVVLVRSMPLRGFDREVVDKVTSYMTAQGVRIMQGLLPSSIVKQPTGKLLVTFSDGKSEEFDTVLAAVGRNADTKNLGLESIGVQLNPKNGKIICNNEQTSVPNVYAIGDVVDNVPELTPSAILAGKLLAKRLYDNGTTPMVYTDIATTVFTPLEFGTVGLTEDAAVEKYGEANVDCFISTFTPLEWSIANKHGDVACYSKIVVNKTENNKVIGLHIAAPNAGEIIQGFAVGFRKGIYYEDLVSTVGIHPTTAEEFTTMAVSKSSGVDSAKAGC